MIKKDEQARIAKIAVDAVTDEIKEIFALFSGPGRINVEENHVLNTFAQHPPLALAFLSFNRYLLMQSTLPVRLRQIAIMRVAWVTKSRYVWSSHLRTSLRNGLTDEVFESIKTGSSSPYWTADEKLIIQATEQLLDEGDLDDAMFQSLSTVLETRQLMDFIFTVGAYQLLASVCKSLRIEREDALLELADRYGAPQ